MIPEIDNINIDSSSIANINNISVGNVGIGRAFVRDIQIANVRQLDIRDVKVWMNTPPESLPITVPVTIQIGKPVVDMPGCVKVHKENVRQRSKNNMLVNDDPKGNTVLCDNGMPYYQPPEYQQNRLTWTTVTPKEPEADGVNSEQPNIPTPEVPGTPKIPSTKEEEKECPGPKDLRVGDYTTSGDEKVIGHKWNSDETVCITLYDNVGAVEKYLPSPQIVTTTATIAVVATSSALLAKPLADLLLKVVKPAVKKIIGKIQKLMGKKEKVLSLQERKLKQKEANAGAKAARQLKGK